MNYATRMITAQGVTGSVEFDGATIVITKPHGSKMIPLNALSSLQLHPKTFLGGNAYIEFGMAGTHEMTHRISGQLIAQVKNENVVIFSKKQQPEFVKLRDAIMAALRAA